MDIALGLFLGGVTFIVFEAIDYYHFNGVMKKRFLPNQNSIIVLDDEETYSLEGFYIQVSDEELERITDGEKVCDVVREDTRWRAI